MIISFKHKGLKNFFLKGDASGIVPAQKNKVRLILGVLNGAKEIRDLNFPGSRLHQLKGKLAGFWSITVTGNWRIIFKFDDNDIELVDYLDYH